ncbi:MAG: DUF4954 family protein, partial [Muribaculaceae bacterium]|nr:DUF4954 family protein [Muribaculaceae bacterium]
MEYRSLTADEISRLESNGCVCHDWSRVKVADAFSASACRSVRFSGDVELGDLSGSFTLEGGIVLPAGITNAAIHNCRIGNHVYIKDISNYLAGYDVADDVFIENVDRIVATGKSSYGNGVDVSVLNETGGREVPMYERLSAQIAYLIAMYRHRPAMVARLRQMIADFAAMRGSQRPVVGHHARV